MDSTSSSGNRQLLLTWRAPLRAYKRRSNSILRFYVALALLLSLIVFFFGDIVLLVPILTLLFLFYVLTITPPPEIDNTITTFGIETAGISLRWELLSHFYYTKKFHFNILTLVSNGPYYYHAFLVVPDEKIKTQINSILSDYVMYVEKPHRSFTDKVVEWLSNLMPDDEDLGQEHSSSPQTPMPTSLSPQKAVTI